VVMEKEPGTIELIDKNKIAQYNVSTHAMPLSFLIKYLETTGSFKIRLLGIQPKNMELGDYLSVEVKESIQELVTLFHTILNE
jgi:hydrogenase 3 maturation protease